MWLFIAGFAACFFSFILFGYVLLAWEDGSDVDPYCTDGEQGGRSFEETAG